MNNPDKATEKPRDFEDYDAELGGYVEDTRYHDGSGTLSWLIIAGVLAIIVAIFAFCPISCHAQDEGMAWTNAQIADAIYLAEGGQKAKVAYGILSVKVKDEAEARKVCIRTIQNNRKRYADYGYKKYGTFLEFLASRYCPVEAHELNQYWLKNVKYFLAKDKK